MWDAGVRMRGADERHVQRIRHRDVVEEPAVTREQARVFATADGLAEGAGDSHAGETRNTLYARATWVKRGVSNSSASSASWSCSPARRASMNVAERFASSRRSPLSSRAARRVADDPEELVVGAERARARVRRAGREERVSEPVGRRQR